MKNRKIWLFLAACLLAIPLLSACTQGNDPAVTTEQTDGATDVETEAEVILLTVDASYRIVIAADADDVTRKTADMVAAAFQEKAGLFLAVVTDAEAVSEHEIVLGVTNRAPSASDDDWNLDFIDSSMYLHAGDPITLYYAAEAILERWLTSDFGLRSEGCVTLAENRVEELNQLATKRDTSVKIMTQNMRGTSDPDGNSVQERSERFIRMMREYAPDLVGTQEFSYSWDTWLHKHAEAMGVSEENSQYGIIGCYNSGPDRKQGGMNAILYRRERFELLESDTFWLSDTPDVPSTVEGTRDKRICTWALFRDQLTGETFLFANTHLDHTSDALREAQAKILMHHLTAMFGDYPVYLTGDMNCYSGTLPYNVLDEELMDAHRETWIDRSNVQLSYHDYGNRIGNAEIDYIFFNDKLTPVSYEIISKDYNGYVSDHYGVIAEFVND